MTTQNKEKNKLTNQVSLLWGLICSMSSIDQQKNNISLFNIISQLNVPKEELEKANNKLHISEKHEIVIVLRRVLSSSLCTDKISVDVKVSLVDPSKNILNEIITPIMFPENKRTMRFRFQLSGFNITTLGDYVYRIEMRQPTSEKMEFVDEIPFEVIETTV